MGKVHPGATQAAEGAKVLAASTNTLDSIKGYEFHLTVPWMLDQRFLPDWTAAVPRG
jgi:X-X-X-Leu-X-X-Gly heptad repeat protein